MWGNSDPMKVHNGSVGDESVNHRKKEHGGQGLQPTLHRGKTSEMEGSVDAIILQKYAEKMDSTE